MTLRQRFSTWFSSVRLLSRPLQIILLLAFLNAVLYLLVVPPWWHYDEPGQFEYVWLMANRERWPQVGEFDESMRLEMARSMQRYGWYAMRNYTPDFSGTKPIWIGAAQTGGKPAYYFLVSLPLRLIRGADITLQYNIVRLMSLLFYLLTVLMIWKAMGELVSPGNPLQWLVTGFVALLPAFTDIMLSINDDVGAIAASCLFLWLSIRLIKQGFSMGQLVPWVIALILCYLAKNTTWYALLLAPFVLLFSLLRGRLMWLTWAATPVIALIAAIIVLEGGGAASWYQIRTQTPPLRLESNNAVAGKYVFQLDYAGGRRAAETGQFLSKDLISRLRGKTLTLGVWIWTDRDTVGRLPYIRFATDRHGIAVSTSRLVRLQSTPKFYRAVLTVPSNANYGILIPPAIEVNGSKIPLFFDGIALAEGAYTGPPQFTDTAGSEGTWSGRPFHNLIENGSAEQGGLRVRPAIDQKTSRFLSNIGRLSAIFSLTADWQGTSWYYTNTFQTLSRTFWASVAADKFNLPGSVPNDVLLGLTLVGILGSARLLWRKRTALRWDLVYILLGALVLVWSITTVRGISSMLLRSPSFAFARYAFPAILPTALVICAGWAEWLQLLGWRYRLSRKALYALPLGMMGVLSLYTLFNVLKYFHPSLANREWQFWLAGILALALAMLLGRNQLRASLKEA